MASKQLPPSEKIPSATSEKSPAAQTSLQPPAAAPEGSQPKQQQPKLDPEVREALNEMLNTSSEGLVEETRNGVTSVDLQGRFQSVPVATIDEDGNVQITDYTHLPKERKQP